MRKAEEVSALMRKLRGLRKEAKRQTYGASLPAIRTKIELLERTLAAEFEGKIHQETPDAKS